MKKNTDGSVTFTGAEVRTLQNVITDCREMISSFPSSGEDLLGDSFVALCIWEDKLNGHNYELSWYTEEEWEGEDEKKLSTVDEWLEEFSKDEE